jgi:adenosine deaminase
MRHGYPLVELHRHLDGNVRLETVVDLARRHGVDLPAADAEGLRPYVQVTEPEPDLVAFLAKFEHLRRIFVDYDAVRRVARENVEDAAAEGIDYVELRFSPYFMAEHQGLDPAGVVEAACDGIEEAVAAEAAAGVRPPGAPPRARVIGILSRHYGPQVGWIELAAALAQRHRGVVAIDLAGDEAGFPGELFVDHFRRAREEGMRVVAHAGEAAGAASVRQAVEGLGAERIGHGVRAVEDPSVVDLLIERGVPLEVCPTSNLQTSTVPSWQAHPLRELLERGVRVTLNTDDPSISGIDLAHEYRVASEKLGLTEDQLRAMQETALEAAFLSDEERQTLRSAPSTEP